MNTYSKVDTLWNRDKETFTVIPGDWRRPEFALINKWLVSEKIDGTNIRLIFLRGGAEWELDGGGNPTVTEDRFEVRGKTDRADLPKPLLKVLTAICERIHPQVIEIMRAHDVGEYTLYGEGYGPGIQSGGYYRNDPSFILFDIKSDGVWLNEGTVWATADELGIDRVPQLVNPYPNTGAYDRDETLWTTEDIVRYVRDGDCRTTFALEEREAEGVIAKSPVPLYNSRGERVMWKLKASDFRAGKR